MKREKRFFAVPLATECKHAAYGGQANIPKRLALDREQFQLRGGILFVLRKQKSIYDAGALENGIALRNYFLPVGTTRRLGISNKGAITRGVVICGDIDFPVHNVGGIKELFAFGDSNRRAPGLQVLQIKLGLR